VSTGASQDIKQASAIARAMVTEWGFSEKLGPILLAVDSNTLRSNLLSPETGKVIDEEVKFFIEKNYERAEKILTDNIDILHAMKDALMKYETIDTSQVDDLMARIEVRPPSDWTAEAEVLAEKAIVEEASDDSKVKDKESEVDLSKDKPSEVDLSKDDTSAEPVEKNSENEKDK